jgi:chloride channel 7
VFAGTNLALLLFATAITASISPAAGGSGIPEVKAYLNGVDAPNIFSLKTLAVKVSPPPHPAHHRLFNSFLLLRGPLQFVSARLPVAH